MSEGEKNPEKVILLYKAVIELIEQGKDINSMKVKEITDQAGIGKGTAYEYFSSKEEIVTNALVYDLSEKILNVAQMVTPENNFKDIIYGILNWIENNFTNSRSFVYTLKASSNSYDIALPLKQEFHKLHSKIPDYHLVLLNLLSIGKRDGLIPEDVKDFCGQTAIVCQIVGFVMFLSGCLYKNDTSIEEAKNFAYESIIKSLN